MPPATSGLRCPKMRFCVLGPVEVFGEGGDPLPIAGSKEAHDLAYLVAHAGSVVSADDLIDELWGERPPRTAEKTFGFPRLEAPWCARTRPCDWLAGRCDCYAERWLPARVREVRDRRARLRAVGDGGPRDPGRGPPRCCLDDPQRGTRSLAWSRLQGRASFGAAEGERLEELRRSAVEDRVDAELGLGTDGTLVAQLEGMVREEPLRERRWGQLMLALYRAERQAEALYRRARKAS